MNKEDSFLNNIGKQYKSFFSHLYSKLDLLFLDEKSNTNRLNIVLLKLLVFAIILIVIILLVDLAIIFYTDKGGVFGDFFGGILNPIFTFLMLFGLIVTIIIQRLELKLSRKEFEKTANALSTQAIESTFFNILNLHHKIVDNTRLDFNDIDSKDVTFDRADKEIFNKIGKEIKKFASLYVSFIDKGEDETILFEGRNAFDGVINFLSYKTTSPEEVLKRYKIIQNENNQIFGHYFRNLYQALRMIDSYDNEILTADKKRKYASILRAQLSSKELTLLCINALEGVCDNGEFKNLIIKYSMLEHITIREEDDMFILSDKIYISKEMLFQYEKIKDLGINLSKTFSGAFGNNPEIPYKLKSEYR